MKSKEKQRRDEAENDAEKRFFARLFAEKDTTCERGENDAAARDEGEQHRSGKMRRAGQLTETR